MLELRLINDGRKNSAVANCETNMYTTQSINACLVAPYFIVPDPERALGVSLRPVRRHHLCRVHHGNLASHPPVSIVPFPHPSPATRGHPRRAPIRK